MSDLTGGFFWSFEGADEGVSDRVMGMEPDRSSAFPSGVSGLPLRSLGIAGRSNEGTDDVRRCNSGRPPFLGRGVDSSSSDTSSLFWSAGGNQTWKPLPPAPTVDPLGVAGAVLAVGGL